MSDAFEQIIGQDAAVERLRSALRRERLPHGLLFAGPEGVGKSTTARALATQFLKGIRVAERVTAGTHPDFHLITRQLVRVHDKTGKSKALAMTVDVIREEIVKPAAHHSTEGGGKVFLVEEAHTMNTAAQNALLKTLEEPAGRTIIILVTDQPDSLLPTIRSRCQTFRFGMLTSDEAKRVVQQQGIAADATDRAVAVAGGSPGRALAFLRDGVVDKASELFSRLLDPSTHGLQAWLKEAAEAYAASQLELDPLGSKDAFTRAGYTLYLSLAADHYRRRLASEQDEDGLEILCANIDALARADLFLNANVNVGVALQQLEMTLQ